MGGVGKTTLLTQINNESLKTPNDFEIVIWVEVSRDLKTSTVQESIGRKIGYSDDFWMRKPFYEKAGDIFNALSKKRFLLLLDDIWVRVDLNKIGVPVPVPNMNNGSKVVFTTRSEEICGRMEAHKSREGGLLGTRMTLGICLRKKVGDQTLCYHPRYSSRLAEAVARECEGLPLAPSLLVGYGLHESTRRMAPCYRARESGHYAIGHLLRACLLEDRDDCVRMHDVIRDMALWIASDIERDQHKFFRANRSSTKQGSLRLANGDGVEGFR
ncbi:hypothetical protein OIU85_002727 [Salix viminalis]|uniref:NB-ARC domain-containing protein n=1 Tax=Salix viminalis TaxID=40686 RepID=A0A9Q0ZZ53_SALVM|nr:hypothetical protein OIU85_002727 [Salix viminalis]